MYNIHQYNNAVRAQEESRLSEERYAKYLLRHGDFKERASMRSKQRAGEFLQEQSQSSSPFVFEDDHFIRWRPNKQFRDVEDSNKFVSFKSFRHKPNFEMDKYFNERERKEIKELSLRKQSLVKSKVIPEEQRGRSLRCQGPLNPKIQFRDKKKDHEYLQPRLRFTNITDRQRMNESAMSFDDKFKTLYNSFEMTKSKLGRQTFSPKKERYSKKDSLDMINDLQSSQMMTKSKPFYFQKDPNQQMVPSLTLTSKLQNNPQMQTSSELSPRSKKKTYFKLAKTMHLFSPEKAEKQKLDLLFKRTQYERSKDMTNIRSNLHGQNYIKAPIL